MIICVTGGSVQDSPKCGTCTRSSMWLCSVWDPCAAPACLSVLPELWAESPPGQGQRQVEFAVGQQVWVTKTHKRIGWDSWQWEMGKEQDCGWKRVQGSSNVVERWTREVNLICKEVVGEKMDLVAFFPQATCTDNWELLLLHKACLSTVRVIIL